MRNLNKYLEDIILLGGYREDQYVDLPECFRPRHGEPRRTRDSHPYNYDPFMVCGHDQKTNGGDYSDRLYEWNYEKAKACAEKHLCGVSEFRNLAKVEAFLRDYHDQPELNLAYVIQMCNVSNGYPVWYFGYNLPSKDKDHE